MSFARIRFVLSAAILVAGVATAFAETGGPATTENVMVEMDHAKIFRIAAPAGTIIIGNPGVADATLQDTQTLIITGHSFGETNLIVLDGRGETISEARIRVVAPEAGLVSVYRGPKRQSLSCLPDCQPVPVIGDAKDSFTNTIEQATSRDGSVANLSSRSGSTAMSDSK